MMRELPGNEYFRQDCQLHCIVSTMKCLLMGAVAVLTTSAFAQTPKIDRKALVQRHNIKLTQFDALRPMQVGNGEFAYCMDITGMQSFVPFNTMSQWGWHSGPAPRGLDRSQYQGSTLNVHGREVWHPLADPNQPELSSWLMSSPHKVNLGRIGLALRLKDGSLASQNDLQNPTQALDLWSGVVTSRFLVEGVPVTIKTASHPNRDAVAFHIESPLLKEGRIEFFTAMRGNNPVQFADYVGDWDNPSPLQLSDQSSNSATLGRQMDDFKHHIRFDWSNSAQLIPPQKEATGKLTIVKAEYGADTRWADVTEKVSQMVKDGLLKFKVDNTLTSEDPAPHTVKRLRVSYSTGGAEQTAEAGENATLLIDAAPQRSRWTLKPSRDESIFSFVAEFAVEPRQDHLKSAQAVLQASREEWPKFWQRGGAIDLSESTDPRWKELERRIVLSQYQMKVNASGSLPPQESGLVNNGWYGKFHMEMYWWHGTHWALWNRWPELNKSLGIYNQLYPEAWATANRQGYKGARWQKAVGNNFVEWPHIIHSTLIWQQPHPIFFAELDYRAHPTPATLKKWESVIEETASFMASYAWLNPETKKYDLGPPVHMVSENGDFATNRNPTYELSYWRFGLRMAQTWRERQGKSRNAEWDTVLNNLAPLPVKEGIYVLHEDVVDMWTKFNFEHPALIGTYGMLPGDGVDRPTHKRTLARIKETWNFNHTWGWDFPMLAMAEARNGNPDEAINYLLHSAPGFQFDERGLATGGPFPYHPSNGALLYAVALMAAGWDGAPDVVAPGFPKNGWKVKVEGISPAI